MRAFLLTIAALVSAMMGACVAILGSLMAQFYHLTRSRSSFNDATGTVSIPVVALVSIIFAVIGLLIARFVMPDRKVIR